jgi:predicted MFS family arabinose efflux permease
VIVKPDAHAPTRESRQGWRIVAALAVTVTASYGVLTYAFGIVLVPMQHDLGLSRLELAGAFSVALAVWALAGIAVDAALDAYSPRFVLLGGSVLAVVLVLAWSEVVNAVQLYLVFAGLGVAMAAVLYNAVFTVATRRFPERPRQAVTVISFAGAFASLIFAPLTGRLTVEFGWRAALVVLAALLALITVPLHALVSAPPVRAELQPKPRVSARRMGNFHALNTSRFWLLALALAFGSFCWSAVVVHLVPLLLDAGRSIEFATLTAGVVGISQLPGRLAFALLGDALSGPRLPIAAFGLGLVALGVLAFERSDIGVLSFAVLFGMSAGLMTLLSATAPAELFHASSYGTVSGGLFACSNAARAAGPFGSAGILILPGKYTALVAALAVLNALAGILGAAAFRGQHPDAAFPCGQSSAQDA